MLEHIIPSKARRKILQLFFHNPNESFYLRKIVRDIDEEVNAVKRELDILSSSKLLNKEKRLNKIFYSLNRSFIFYDEFLRIFTKSTFLADNIYKNLAKLGKCKFIVVSSKFAKQIPIKEDEIYLLIVGIIVVPEISSIVAEAEKQFGREINYTVMTEEEFAFRKKNNDPFIWRFLKQPKVMLVGSEDDMLK
ncbi:hypothetical protein A3C98_05605 [Candidatus Roizmanbacteria bacterium RIFCSPHIGHO2_02_FULL_37_15]|uniref:HTH arsR-type domain-containing protein n=1 Tax=Candidatus Roizmanbacteria bacterium RIFCSPLOWO2_01_FULL_37_16 TaxID=1802058 RepID=A0A1F7IPQ5_9BACT|nr:MAG: hypothetical protein A2859_03545 [Candidatus Roizmanbacteria bacterium RIFCSPHIGHO2_01_FULL_37_16b]OGK21487.1 MAG: hypothetical protein A3C98_05605 [Candidatus Roizmanbacteria bacterium RIFCSPHIGHO2_02_FULL_37_15]OGK34127.1 MAG: hypothetical protein A3F57_00570 [Candidatus Roizmanbacteria bacterium RIFCSPHIGHO2_12_FULL_36_11]OGK45357.1 MAG: hypothetical protein A3B40_03345 [Candidatus Roizmanbacteria bacterium RIFCSPLOWO2_01_FULL_37_16]OGK57658.1 MAG: hypothetical protein A3I50_03900 [C